ncbi:MAG: nucleotidyltransferase family protein [Erysipelotrichaceae bacterium]
MKIAGLVNDCNSLRDENHTLIEQVRTTSQCDVLIMIMAGHFMQSGEPSGIDKWQRTKLALEDGVDLVIELPYAYATSDRNEYAKAAIDLLIKADCNIMVFESEINNLEELQALADCSFNINNLIERPVSSTPFFNTYGLGLKAYYPHDILALAYLRALKSSSISACLIQALPININESIPSSIKQVAWNDYYPYLRLKLQTLNSSDLDLLYLISEGLIKHLVSQAKLYASYDEFIHHAIKKRYTKAKIQRALTHILTHTSHQDVLKLSKLDYLRVLGFNQIGQTYLKHLKSKKIKVVTRFNQIPLNYRQMELKASVAYAYALDEEKQNDLIQKEIEGPIIL